jgi:RND family efflux transporter MFP subunit
MKSKHIWHALLTAAFIGLGVFVFIVITANKPQLKRTDPPTPVPMVRVVAVQVETVSVPIVGQGTVRPLREIQIIPEVSGRVLSVSPALVSGGGFKNGETLLRIDPTDYELAVTLAQARIKDSVSSLRLMEEEAAAARDEWRLLNADKADTLDQPPPLVAKLPQLEAAKAQLAADRADLQKALLNLERTEIKAPFDGRVIEENAGAGQYVSPGQPVATIFSTEVAEIVVPLEDESLYWFHVPGFTPGDGPGAPATVSARIAGRNLTWQGRVDRSEGKVDERTRMINVIVRVEAPYATKPPLAAGLFASVEIQGRTIPEAAIVPRAALRENDRVWVVDDTGRLAFRDIEVARLYPDRAILTDGLRAGELVVISPLNAVTDGMAVRINAVSTEGAS